jgi:hypothetical protein
VEVPIPHNSPSVVIQVTTGIDQDASDESWGVRNFQLYAKNDGSSETLFESDLTSNTFTTSEGWTITHPYSSDIVSTCGSVRLLGGYNILGANSAMQKVFVLPPHYQVRIQFKLMKYFVYRSLSIGLIHGIINPSSFGSTESTNIQNSIITQQEPSNAVSTTSITWSSLNTFRNWCRIHLRVW